MDAKHCNVSIWLRVLRPLCSFSLSLYRPLLLSSSVGILSNSPVRKVENRPWTFLLGVNLMCHIYVPSRDTSYKAEHKSSKREWHVLWLLFFQGSQCLSLSLFLLCEFSNRFKRRWAMPWPLCDNNNKPGKLINKQLIKTRIKRILIRKIKYSKISSASGEEKM